MVNPVLAPDGHTYEKEAIEEWIRNYGTSPQTRQPIKIEDLVPNRALRDILEHEQKEEDENNKVASKSKPGIMGNLMKGVKAIMHPAPISSPQGLLRKLKEETKVTIRKNSAHDNQSLLHIETPIATQVCASSHICCVIDVSGSMGTEATSKDENGMENRTGLTILDIVKFATLVISKSLKDSDKFSIVTYSDDAKVVLSPTNMTEQGKARAEQVIAGVKPQCMTNLWAGIKAGVNLAHEVGNEYISSVFVLTDGVPNIDPPLGYERSLNSLLKKTPIFGNLSTFGFGYSLETQLLVEIAKIGGGYFSFIPDAGFVGTCFINALANSRCIFGVKPHLRINTSLSDTLNITEDGNMLISRKLGKTYVHLTPLRFEAPMDIILNEKITQSSKMHLVFQTVGGKEVSIPVVEVGTEASTEEHETDIFHTTRVQFVKKAYGMTSFRESDKDMFQPPPYASTVRSNNNLVDAMCKDMEGQATEAISRQDWFNRWGGKYLLSLVGAHLNQYCNNFKDPGIQAYGTGELFNDVQEELNDIFEQIPPPKPSATPRSSRYGAPSSNVSYSAAAVNMRRLYNNCNAICVHGNTKVTIIDGLNNKNEKSVVNVSQLKKGDCVMIEDGTFAQIQCIVETVSEKEMPLIQIRDLLVTAYHPVKTTQGWEFPIDSSEGTPVIESGAYSVFNMILEEDKRSNAVIMDGVPSITLGHGIKDDPILFHEYFGSDRVIKDVMKIKSAAALGHVIIRENDVKRINGTGTIFAIHLSDAHTDAELISEVTCN